MSKVSPSSSPGVDSGVALGVYGIQFRWPTASDPILENISFELSRGEILALLGPNGSGKSTLLKLISGILSLKEYNGSGQVKFYGNDFLSLNSLERARRIVYVPPELRTDFPLVAEQVVYLGLTCQRSSWLRHSSKEEKEMVQQAMETCLCWELRDREIDTLSGGEKQLVALARALAQGSQILLLDEAFSWMDLQHLSAMGRVLENLASRGKTIILVSHDINLASAWSNSILFLKNGKKVFHDTIKAFMTQENIEQLYPQARVIVTTDAREHMPRVFLK